MKNGIALLESEGALNSLPEFEIKIKTPTHIIFTFASGVRETIEAMAAGALAVW